MEPRPVEHCGSGITSSEDEEPQDVWHCQLGHLNTRSMALMKNGIGSGVSFNNNNIKTCTLIEDRSRKTIIYFLKSKDVVFENF